MGTSDITEILSALNTLTLELNADCQLEIIGSIPRWVQQEFEDVIFKSSAFQAELFSSFLSNFLIDAEEVWEYPTHDVLRSGLWTQVGQSGQDVSLEAVALHVEGRRVLLIELSELAAAEKFQWLQTAREKQLDHISQQKEANQQLFRATCYDSLTGLPNRGLFSSQLETCFEISRGKKEQRFAVVVFNIDRFQLINNCMGTAAGAQVLIAVAKRICGELRQQDIPVRFGSDEFGVLLKHISSEDIVINIVEKLLYSIEQPLLINGYKTSLAASAGISISGDWYKDSNDLLRDASLALQKAKGRGHGHYRVFNRTMRTQALRLWSLESELRDAIAKEQFQLYYQPIVTTTTQRIERFEALVRWQHPDRGWIPPSKFIPLAEASGLIVAIDTWALKTACQTIQHWQTKTNQTAYINVNISPHHFTEGDLLKTIEQTIRPLPTSLRTLCIEITEGSFLSQPRAVIKVLNQIKALDIQIAMDDFGTGYASLSYLQDLPLDILKIDGCFIKKMKGNSYKMVQTIIELGQALGLSITAEQVETLSEYKRLKALGCDTLQGFLFSKPLSASEAQSLINTEAVLANEHPNFESSPL